MSGLCGKKLICLSCPFIERKYVQTLKQDKNFHHTLDHEISSKSAVWPLYLQKGLFLKGPFFSSSPSAVAYI